MIENYSQHFKEFFNRLGFKRFHVELHKDLSDYNTDTYRLYLSFINQVEVSELRNKTPVDILNNNFNELMSDIENSEYVQSRLNDLRKENEELKKRVKELEPFETYYNLHFKMQNGVTNETKTS